MEENIIIYSLTCPIKKEVKYIGVTRERVGLKKRLTQHICDRNSNINRKNNWIRNLFNQNLRPIIEPVDVVPYSEWYIWESYYISLFRSWGFELYNINPGGENPPVLYGVLNHNFGKKLKEETKQKISNTLKGQTIPDNVKQKISNSLKGRTKTLETCKRISISKKGKNGKAIIYINIFTGENIKFNSLSESALTLKVNESTIRRSIKNNAPTKKGFYWKFL